MRTRLALPLLSLLGLGAAACDCTMKEATLIPLSFDRVAATTGGPTPRSFAPDAPGDHHFFSINYDTSTRGGTRRSWFSIELRESDPQGHGSVLSTLDLDCTTIATADLLVRQTLPLPQTCRCAPGDSDCPDTDTDAGLLIVASGRQAGSATQATYALSDGLGTLDIDPTGDPVNNGTLKLTVNIAETTLQPLGSGPTQRLAISNLSIGETISSRVKHDCGSLDVYSGWRP